MDATTTALFDEATSALRAQRWDLAESIFREILQREPDHPVALQLLGVVAFETNRLDLAVSLMERAVTNAPTYVDAHYNLANVRLHLGRAIEAAAGFRRVLTLEPHHFGAQLNLGGTLARLGRLGEALDAYHAAVDLEPGSAMAQANYANALKDAGRSGDALTHYQAALRLDPNSADAHNNIGLLYRELGQYDAAIQALEQAVRLAPDNTQFQVNLRDSGRRLVPAWHFRMLADQARNDAYQRAIEKAAPGRRLVLDIGTGSGLLAMMAARAGARRVIACEMVAPLARVAERIVARNGYADRISVLAKRSTELAMGRDLAEPADLLISEIVDAGLLGEGMLRTLRHAQATLITGDAALIPAGATVWGALIECPDWRRVNPIADISGFDLGEFDGFRNPVAHQQFDMAREPHRLLSATLELAQFDFRRLPDGETSRPVTAAITADGTAHAMAFWFDLHLDAETTLSTRPGSHGASHWRQAIAFFDRDRPVRQGESVNLGAGHSDSHFFFRWSDR